MIFISGSDRKNFVENLIGQADYKEERKFLAANNSDAEIVCRNCSINAFFNEKVTPNENGYVLEALIGLPQGKIITIPPDHTTGYGVNVLLKDKQGNVVKNQQQLDYQWSVSNPNIVQIIPTKLEINNGCIYDINPPCPFNHVDLYGINPGEVIVSVRVLDKSKNGLEIASTSFPVLVQNLPQTFHSETCVSRGEVIKKNQPGKCCPGLTLVPPTDDRVDIFGTCLASCSKNSDCYKDEVCKLTATNQLVCVPRDKSEPINTQEIQNIKKEVEKIRVRQSNLEKILNQILVFIKKFFHL